MTGSQIKQEAPETNTFKMAGNKGRPSVKFEKHLMQGVRIWLPNIEEFLDQYQYLGRRRYETEPFKFTKKRLI